MHVKCSRNQGFELIYSKSRSTSGHSSLILNLKECFEVAI